MTINPYEEKKYTPGQSVIQARQELEQQQAAKPGDYQSQFQSGMDQLLGQIRNRPGFQYDVNSDALYRQVAQNYLNQGRQAMMDTMGQAAAMTGGYGNSYAQTAGQQAYGQYLTGLTDLVPQYYQMALDRYQLEGDDLLRQYELLAGQEDRAFDRYQKELEQYYANLDRAQANYDRQREEDYSRFTDDRNFDYGKYRDETDQRYREQRDQVSDEQWARQLAYQQERDRIRDEQWLKEFEEEQRQYNENLAWQQAKAAAKTTSGSRSSSGSTGYKALETELKEGNYNSAQMLQLIRGSSLTEKQQDRLVSQYQKPLQKQEVAQAAAKRPNDTSAYWGSR